MNAKTNKAPDTPREEMAVIGSDLVKIMAKDQHLDHNAYAATVKATCFEDAVTREQFLAFLMVAKEHNLNPITREIYGFAKGNKIQPIVSIDGWLKIINSHPDFDGMEFEDHIDDEGGILAITCRIHRIRNGRESNRPTQVTEYLSECKRDTAPWNKWPIRMLRHKATIQCARYAFGFSGIVDADEAERIKETSVIEGSAHIVREALPTSPAALIKSKIKGRVEESDSEPVATAQEPYIDPETGEIVPDDLGKQPKTAGGDTSTAVALDGEIPSLESEKFILDTKGKEGMSQEDLDEFVAGLEGKEPNNA